MEISAQGKKEALALARWTLESKIGGSDAPKPSLSERIFDEKRGAFVTLRRKKGELRGCVGRVEPLFTVKDEIIDLAMGAATRDPRFTSVSSDELEDTIIEISILTPTEMVKDTSEIQVGKHGVIIENDLRRGLLLPQVATEEEWEVETFLEHACLKAGLPTDAWNDPNTVIYRFSATVFSE